MSGKEPTWNEDEETSTSGDIYGAPKGTPRPGEETADSLEPMGFVEPLSLDDDSGEAEELRFADEHAPARAASGAKDAQAADDDDADLGLGNRPAEGARVVSASEIFSEDFIGAEGASDFLGLDTDFDPMPIPKDGGLELDFRDAPATALATEEARRGYVSPLSPPDFGADGFEPGHETEFGDEVQGDLGYDDDELLADESFDDEPLHRKGRRGLLVAGAFALGLAAVGAALYGPGYFGGGAKSVEVASTGAKTTPKGTPGGAGTATTDPIADPGTGIGTETGADPAVDPDPLDPIETPWDPSATDPDLGATDPEVAVETDPDPALDPESAAPIEPVDPTPVLPVEDTAQTELLKRLLAESAELERLNPGSGGLLDLVWRGESVPMEAIGASGRILTPAVGPVRVHMASLDVFDGRLFAVGEDKVWIDLDLGRIGLAGAAIERIERLPKKVASSTLDASDLLMGGRVRARVPGGVIYGRIRSQTGNSVTLVTDSGARITLVDPILENVGEKKSVVLKL